MVSARNLTKVYGRGSGAVTALDSVNVDIARARFTAIMGPSGSGKSTLMHCLAGLDSITSGEIMLDGDMVSSMNQRRLTRLRRERIGFIFQSFNLVGQVQRVACARALVGEPAVVFADEPTGNLDSHSTDQVLEILRRSVDDLGQSVVMVTHEPEAAAWADTVIFLRDGHVVAQLDDPDRDRVLDALRELSETEPAPAAAPQSGSAVKGA